jgi:hypothetical protein
MTRVGIVSAGRKSRGRLNAANRPKKSRPAYSIRVPTGRLTAILCGILRALRAPPWGQGGKAVAGQ